MKLQKPAASVSFPELEQTILARWAADQTFQASLDRNDPERRFTFYDGPPFATGRPHYGHLLQATIKDVIPRFKTMQGFYVERRFGWDCHGLPVEYELEKERGIRSRQEILEMGIDVFNEACRGIVQRHAGEFQEKTERIGRWVDFEHDYKTMDPDYMESIWWVVKTLHQKGLLYEGRKAMHICPRCATPLSNFEVSQAYRDRQDPAVYVTFPLASDPKRSLVAWTTTPWTLPGNVLVAVDPALSYSEVIHRGKQLIMATSRLTAVLGEEPYELVGEFLGATIVGEIYLPLFPVEGLTGKHYEVVPEPRISAEEGSGILHVAPAFGEDDLALGEAVGAAFLRHVDMTGHIIAPADPRYVGKEVLDANSAIIADLKHAGRVLRHDTISHSYPHCWRCDTPLLNYTTDSWFVAVTKLKDRLLEENQHINWIPEHIRDGRFGKWLEGARDWSISRHRFWGNPLPVWRCSAHPEHLVVVGSRDELEQFSGHRPDDLHKHFVDKIVFPCADCDGEMNRVEDVLDCWFESGSMPYAEQHYPFENADEFPGQFPADFIAEGLDQTRGWFYTLHVLGVALQDSRAFQNVMTTGLVLAEDGKKMSKSLKNYPDPTALFDTYGADALRLYLLTSPIVRGDNLRFAERGVAETVRSYSLTLWNCYSFLATYAEVEHWKVVAPPPQPENVLDRWILSRLQSVTVAITNHLESYALMEAAREAQEFLEELSNWYVRRSRRRFWKSADSADTAEAFATLHHMLVTFCQLTAPLTPFLSDEIYRLLTGEPSVHLTQWPEAAASRQDSPLEARMSETRQAVTLGLAAREKAGLRLRQPIAAVVVTGVSPALSEDTTLQAILQEELNAKQVLRQEASGDGIEKAFTPVPGVIGPLTGDDAQAIIQAVKRGEVTVQDDGSYSVGGATLPADAVKQHWHSTNPDFALESDGRISVSIDTRLDDSLRQEGLARELIRHFQDLRKEAGLAVENRIRASVISNDASITAAATEHDTLIAGEILASSLEVGDESLHHQKAIVIADRPVTIALTHER